MDHVWMEARGPKLGSVCFIVQDGAVLRGRVQRLMLGQGLGDKKPVLNVGVRWYSVDGDEMSRVIVAGEVYGSAAAACRAAFSDPEPELRA